MKQTEILVSPKFVYQPGLAMRNVPMSSVQYKSSEFCKYFRATATTESTHAQTFSSLEKALWKKKNCL
jgi:hypothetical protein